MLGPARVLRLRFVGVGYKLSTLAYCLKGLSQKYILGQYPASEGIVANRSANPSIVAWAVRGQMQACIAAMPERRGRGFFIRGLGYIPFMSNSTRRSPMRNAREL